MVLGYCGTWSRLKDGGVEVASSNEEPNPLTLTTPLPSMGPLMGDTSKLETALADSAGAAAAADPGFSCALIPSSVCCSPQKRT